MDLNLKEYLQPTKKSIIISIVILILVYFILNISIGIMGSGCPVCTPPEKSYSYPWAKSSCSTLNFCATPQKYYSLLTAKLLGTIVTVYLLVSFSLYFLKTKKLAKNKKD
ncbi:MAG: hypothetical protein H6500_00595 [Candidatus Woesearchaeota archaeon]|nr:MAG: hypothetical protein H6500_00595 [Candidatus Woesearchaeota archaeon]